ncbi:MAG: hypothetical protein ACTH9H_03675 [Galactobacter sp.]
MSRARNRPVLLAIDGRSGAGKSSVAEALCRALTDVHQLDTEVFHVEDAYRGWEGLSAGVDHYVQAVLGPLHRGETAVWNAWDWATDSVDTAARVTRPASVVICEGVGAACAAARRLLDASLTLVAPAATRKRRALARDGDTYRPFWDVWAAQEEEFARAGKWDSTTPLRSLDLTVNLTDFDGAAELERRTLSWALDAITAAPS